MPSRPVLLLVLACAAAAVAAVGAGLAASSARPPGPPIADEAALESVTNDPCAAVGLRLLPKSGACTHGPDPAPPGVDVEVDVEPVTTNEATAAATCDGDGTAGLRTQVLYVRASDRPDRFSQYVNSFRTWAAEADQIYATSAAETGGTRRLRFVHDQDCNITVTPVVVSAAGDDNFDNTIAALQAQGFNRADRKYMLFVDATVYCGVGSMWLDDSPGQANANNGGPSYGRSDAGCWNGFTAAHEHMHNIGGVQMTAPNSSGGGHCTDEYDVMCYSDYPYYPQMAYPCPNSAIRIFDCNHDDYFHTSPAPSNYLATHWNAANSAYLMTSGGGGGGGGGSATISVADGSVTEGNSRTRKLKFVVSLSQAVGQTVKVTFSTADGTAAAGSDYTGKSVVVRLPAGVTSKTVSVTVYGDTTPEPNETVLVNLTSPVNATLADAQAVGTIVNDD